MKADIDDLEIDGSRAVSQSYDPAVGVIIRTDDDREWIWDDQSYRVEPGTPLIEDGEWIEYKPRD